MTTVAVAARVGDSAWTNSDIAWQSPAGDIVAVFSGIGPQGLGSSLAREVERSLGTPPATSASERARWTIRRAHETALAMRETVSGTYGTMASVAWDAHLLTVAHVGNARVYRVRPQLHEIECLTLDDVAGDAEPMNRMLTNVVGGPDGVRIHERQITCDGADVIVCCTSRIWRSLGVETLLDSIATSLEDAGPRIVERLAQLDSRAPGAIAIVRW